MLVLLFGQIDCLEEGTSRWILSRMWREQCALRVKIDETTTSSFITVEGKEVEDDGSNRARSRTDRLSPG